MPGLLKKTAKCPECGRELWASGRTANWRRTRYEYHHGPDTEPCFKVVLEHKVADYERLVYSKLHVISGRELKEARV